MYGLTDKEVNESLKKYGSNKLNYKSENKFYKLFFSALGDPIIKIMLIAVLIRVIFSFQNQNWYETIGMMISILLSSLISSLSEYGSNKSFQELQKKYENINALVKRNGVIKSIPSEEIVVGDIVYLESGSSIPADGVIIEGEIGVDEASISGEATEVLKVKGDLVLKGTIVLSNKATIKVKNVGLNTIYGTVVKELNDASPDSPMKIRLKKLAELISKIGIVGAVFVSISFLFNVVFLSNNFDMNVIMELLSDYHYVIDLLVRALILSLTIIIVCVPEGLPMMVALVLSSNMKRMLKNNVLVRKPVGIETCGSMNVLLADKTGTLTNGELNVIGVIDANDKHYLNFEDLKNNFKEALIYNNQSFYVDGIIKGSNSTDKALLKFTGNQKKIYQIKEYTTFNSNIKYSYVLLDNGIKYYKGASEILIEKCLYYMDGEEKKLLKNKKDILKLISKYTKKGIRVICIVKDNILLGFVLMRDEIRSNAKETLKEINDAGILTIMITGDDKNTAHTIAKELGMLDDKYVIDHDELVSMSDQDILLNFKKIGVIARALPNDKSRVASVLESNGYVVGMTGDGVNDAPALKKASVGISLGSGSEVAKEASDIIILDDNINSILNAILYGRTIFKSIRKFIVFQLTMNFSALFLSIVGPFIGITSPVTIMQMLWINMIMDTLAGLAYSYECPMKRYLKDKPIKKDERILNSYMYISIISGSIFIFVMLILFLKLPIVANFVRDIPRYYLTSFFSLFIFLNIFNAFNTRTERINIFSGLMKNKIFIIILALIFVAQIFIIYKGGIVFRTFGLEINELIFVLLLSLTIIPFDIIKKMFLKNKTY